MKPRRLLALLVVSFMMLALMPAFSFTAAALGEAPEEVWVSLAYDDSTEGWNQTRFASIQDAIDAVAADGTIYILAGLYEEAIYFDKDVTVIGAGRDDTFIHAPDTVPARTWNATTRPVVAIDNSTVHISGVTVDGLRKAGSNASMVGVYFWNASGSLTDSRVTGIRAEPMGGGQNVVAIMINHTWDDHSPQTVTISGNIIDDYQKGGIAVNEPGSVAHIVGNIITGVGPTGAIAQNGIQFGYGNPHETGATIIGNTISGNWYTGAGWSSSGILVLGVNGINIEDNNLDANQVAIYLTYDSAFGYEETTGITLDGNVFTDNYYALTLSQDCAVEVFVGNGFFDNNMQVSAHADAVIDIEAALANNNFDRAIVVRDNTTNELQSKRIYSCFQPAIDAAGAGDVIDVAPGTYPLEETVVVDKAVSIVGPAGHSVEVIGNASAANQLFSIESSGVSIKNLSLTLNLLVVSGTGEYDRALIGIAGSTGDISIVNNILTGPYDAGATLGSMYTRGIVVDNSAGTDIVIEDNVLHSMRNGIVVRYNNSVAITGNVIFNTKGGIMNYTNSDADADNRVMTDNAWKSTDPARINHNEWDIVWNSGGGYAPAAGYEPVIALSQANNGAYVLDRRALSQDGLVGNRSHAFVDLESIYDAPHAARGNFNEPFSTIALGLEAVAEGGTVILVEGTYVEEAIDPTMNLAGKTLTYEMAGEMTLLLPADILPDEAVVITIERVTGDAPDGFKLLSAIYRFIIVDEDELSASFSGNMTMIFYFDPAEVDDPDMLDVYWFDGDEWVALGGVVDMVAGTVTVEVDHWSDFALMEEEETTPETGTAVMLLIPLGMLLMLAGAFVIRKRVLA